MSDMSVKTNSIVVSFLKTGEVEVRTECREMFIRTFRICFPIYMKLTMRNVHMSLFRVFEFLEIRLWEGRTLLMGVNIVTFTSASKTKQDFESEEGLGSIYVLRD
jgi:hypothetical protein